MKQDQRPVRPLDERQIKFLATHLWNMVLSHGACNWISDHTILRPNTSAYEIYLLMRTVTECPHADEILEWFSDRDIALRELAPEEIEAIAQAYQS